MNSNFVVKSNELIRNTRSTFTAGQQKILLHIISKIKPSDTELIYKFEIKELYQYSDEPGGSIYQHVKNSLMAIRNCGFWLRVGNKDVATAFIHSLEVDVTPGMVTVEIHKAMYPHLLNLKSHFTQYMLENVLRLKSKYAIELYEFFKSYESAHIGHRHTLTIGVDELKKRLKIEKLDTYSRTADFKRKLLNKAVEEINRETDITVEIRDKKSGRTITDFIIKVSGKKGREQVMAIPYMRDRISAAEKEFVEVDPNQIDFFDDSD